MMIFVGKRDGALAAAARMALDLLLVVERAPRRMPAGVRAVFEHPFANSDCTALAARVRSLGTVDGVLALTEAAVAPAAHLRRALELPGLQPDAAQCCTDKAAMKRAIAAAGLPCARFVEPTEGLDRDALLERLGLPVVIKPARSSGGRDTRRCERAAALPAALAPGQLAEAFVQGAEMSVETLWSNGEALFINVTEYYEPRWANLLPATLGHAELESLHALNRRVARVLGVERGMTHLEVFRTPTGFVFGEIAARPPGGHLMELLERVYGFDPWAACIELERGGAPLLETNARGYAGVRVLHPGAGTLRAISGLDAVASLPQLARLVCRARPGDVIAERSGAGQEVGYALFASPLRADVTAGLDAARTCIRFELAPAVA